MSVALTINGITYNYPETDDENWGADATDWAVGVTSGMLQKAGGLFQLLAEVDFGTTYGVKSVYYKTRTSNVADAGQFRLAKTDNISWRNNAGDGNLALAINGSDNLTFNGVTFQNAISVTDTSTIDLTFAADTLSADIRADSITNSMINSAAAIAYSKLNLSGSIVNADINSSAAIAYSKLSLTNSIVNADINSAAAIVYSKLDLASSIVNADVSASAAIAYSKLNLTGSIVNADVNAAAAIAYSKLNLSGSIVNADISTSAAIAYSKLSLSGSIVNADINASAAIAFSKLAALSSGNILVGSAGNVATSVAMSGDVTIGNTGVTAIGANKVANSQLAQMAQSTIKGRAASSGTGDPVDLTATQATAILNNFVGDSGSGGTKGLVPAPAAGDAAANKFLGAGGAWSVPTGAGDVTGPASSTADGFVKFNGTTGKVIKDSPATISNSDVNASAAIAVSKLAALTTTRAVVTDGSGFISAATTTAAEIGFVNGVTSAIQTQINTKLPTTITNTGDMIYSSSGTTAARLAVGTNGMVLNTLSGIPAWGYYNSVRSVTGTDSPTTSDRVMLTDATGGSFTITLPAASGKAGLAYTFINTTTANVVTVDGNASETIGGVANIKLATVNDTITIVCDGTNWQVIEYDVHVFAWYNSNAGQSIPNNASTVMNYEDVQEDRLSLVTTGVSWHFTTPFAGTYSVTACNRLDDDGDAGDNEFFSAEITRAGTSITNWTAVVQDAVAAGFDQSVVAVGLISCAANVEIVVNLKQNMGNSTPLTTTAIENYIMIKRVGN